MTDLNGKTAIVTGASSGIGRAIACRFASVGARVVLADVTEAVREGGIPTAELIAREIGEAEFVRTDVSSWRAVDALVEGTVRKHGRLDVMVNNAAIANGKSLLETTESDWDAVMAINLKGVYFGCKRAVGQMLTQEVCAQARGRIVNISSQHGMIGSPGDFAYGVSKAGVVYMTRQITTDYAKDHIICNAIAPGKIITGKSGAAMDPDALAYSRQRTPMPRLGEPADVASAALFLASDEATFINGENLMVDGGWMAS